jgi:hypothetical protein
LGYEPNDESLSGIDFIGVISARLEKTAQIAPFLCAVCAQLLADADAGVRLTNSAGKCPIPCRKRDCHWGRMRMENGVEGKAQMLISKRAYAGDIYAFVAETAGALDDDEAIPDDVVEQLILSPTQTLQIQ